MPFFAFKKINVAENARKTPLILIFEITARTPFLHDDVQTVFPLDGEISDIEFAQPMRNLRKADKAAVDIYVKTRIYSLKDEIQLTLAVMRKIAAIMIRGVLYGNARRIVRKRITDVRILKMIVTVILYARRHVHFFRQCLQAKIVADI